MKSLLLADGDLVVGPGGYLPVTGPSRVTQDLRCALAEPLGTDRFHPGFGSTLDDYIGLIAGESNRYSVEQEVRRVVSNYTAVQRDRIETDALSDARPRFTTEEVITSISGVTVTNNIDTISVRITLSTASGADVVLVSRTGVAA